jgi:hypothetical protein
MNQNEQNFDNLKRLLQLKRHEVPPPGYFNHFSDTVISRIRSGEAGHSMTFNERIQSQVPWLAGLINIFETRPGLVGAFAVSLCVLLLVVVVSSEHSDMAAKNLLAVSDTSAPVANAGGSMTAPPLLASDSTGLVASTNPVTSLQPVATLFGQPASSALFQPASFAPVGH